MKNRYNIRFYCKETNTYFYPNENYMYNVDKKTWANLSVMLKTTSFKPEQSPGLNDKNGKLIYENDWVKIKDPKGSEDLYLVAVDCYGLWTLILEGDPFKYVIDWNDFVKCNDFELLSLEVVGNYSQQPNLGDE